MLQIIGLLNISYSNESDIENILDNCITEFINEMSIESFSDLILAIENIEVKKIAWENRKDMNL